MKGVHVEEIYQECDIVTIHVPLMDATKGMIGKDALEQMKDGVILLNFARDLLVDEKAVLAGIKSGKERSTVPVSLIPPRRGRRDVS